MASAKLAVALLTLAAAGGMARSGGGAEPGGCAATTVRYGLTRFGLPSVAAGKAFTGHVSYYPGILGDARVNRSDGLVAYAGVPGKVRWVPMKRSRAAARLLVSGRRLDGEGTFSSLTAVAGGQFSSQLAIPATGCWRLTLRSGRLKASVVVRAIEPLGPRCEPTPRFSRTPPHPRFGAITWMPATPRTDGVAAIRFVSIVPGADRALIYAGGRAPEGWNTKFLWWSPRPGASLSLSGRRLDAEGRFEQEFGRASSDEGTVFPSILDIPHAGCWAVTVRTGHSAGVVVFQAVASG